MLTLLLLRHGDAVAASGGDDRLRGLTATGRSAAAAVGTFLRGHGLIPTRAIVSSAARTRQTLACVEDALRVHIPADFDPSFYDATPRQLRDVIARTDASIETLLVIGHNPGVSELALAITSDSDAKVRDAMRTQFPPCGLAVITFDDTDWRAATQAGGHIERFVLPMRAASSR